VRFGPTPLADSVGGVVAHSVRLGDLVLKKGDVVTTAHVRALAEAGVHEIVVARLEPGDVGEDEAAERLALAVAGDGVRVAAPFTGRSNLFAAHAGVLMVDGAGIDRVNDVDETLTVATLSPWKTVVEGEMVATVKVIPYAAPQPALDAAVTSAGGGLVRVAAFRPMKVGVVSTLLPGLKIATVDKTLRVMAERIAPWGGEIVADVRVAHEPDALADAIRQAEPAADIIVVFGASAITDRRDVIPAALLAVGGEIIHLGMPVDPGNLLLVGRMRANPGAKPLLGAPGCARSPKENGFDWVLQRLFAGVEVTAGDIRRMGVGGLLMEIVDRGQPRDAAGE